MKKLTGFTALTSGLLLVVVPRFLLQPCEYHGYSPMHCSATMWAVVAVGTLLALTGGAALLLKSGNAVIISSLACLSLLITAFILPGISGYCGSIRMPCYYGMVPGIRFIAAAGGIAAVVALIGIFKRHGKKGTA